MRVAAIGECMIELSPAGDGQMAINFGGDTLNTAVYMARLGADVDYVTQLGDDHYSDQMLEQWRDEGVGVDLVRQRAGRLPGLYLIHNDSNGERYFNYWRRESPARELFDESSEALFEKLSQFDYLYFSGITLSLYAERARESLLEFCREYRLQGGKVVFDLNYRPANWGSESQAKQAILAMLPMVDIALPSFDDEQLLFGFEDAQACLDHYRAHGVGHVVLKDGLRGCFLAEGTTQQHFSVRQVVEPLDTTAAGDSFNAGYLAALVKGCDSATAIDWGQSVAGLVIQHRGAIIERSLFINSMQQFTNEVVSA